MNKKHKIAVVGLGQRGVFWAKTIMEREDTELIAIADVYEDRVASVLKVAKEMEIDTIKYAVTDYTTLLDKKDIGIVMIVAAWESHVPLAIEFMNAGIVTALEVGGAYCLEDCFQLVHTYEATGTPFFFMENCCYGKRETMVTNMVRQGLFGSIVHCSGSYSHDLREEIAAGEKNRHYRFRNYVHRNCDNYPTHELGPIAKLLNINHGNRMLSLVSVSSKAEGLQQYIQDKHPELSGTQFIQGDVVNTIITCANGETILLTLDTTLPCSYSRSFRVRGTKGMYYENNDMVYLDEEHYPKYEFDGKSLWGNAGEYEDQYLTQAWKDHVDTSKGHGGMDAIMLSDMLRCLDEGLPMPIDVYDAASWMSVSVLSEESIQKGGAPVMIPDFTRGQWIK